MDPIFLDALAVWHNLTPGDVRATARVLIIHGISEHSGRHQNTISYLTRSGFEVVSFDLRGSGRSGGRRQWIESFHDYIEDASHVFNWIGSNLNPLPLFILGHSLGGAIATYFAAEYWKVIHGLVLSAPAYRVGNAISPVLLKASHLLAKLTPGIRISKSGNPNAISRDLRCVKEYQQDPLCYHFNTVRQATEVLNAIENLPKIASKIYCPTLIVHGTGDRIILLEGSFDIMKTLPSKDKTFHIFPGGFHELHNDWDKELYFSNLRFWLNNHLL